MARVVRRRKNPLLPVLIIFVFLFVISAALAVIFFNEKDSAQKDLAAQRDGNSRVASKEDMKPGWIKSIMKAYNRQNKRTVVAELASQVQSLTRLVAGFETSTQDVEARVNQLRVRTGSSQSLLDEIDQAYEMCAKHLKEVVSLQKELTDADTKHADLAKLHGQLDDKFKAGVSRLADEKLALAKDLDTAEKEHLNKLTEVDKQWQAKLDKEKKEVDKQVARVRELSLELQKKENKIRILQQEKQQRIGLDSKAIRPAGKIKEVVPGQPICFIPLGSRDRVVRGLTFRVYGPEGIPEEGTGYKASLTVTHVREHISRCRINQLKKDDPVVAGDLFANVAFNPTRTPVFVVVGKFDIFGTGQPTTAGTQQVIELIKKFRGKIAKELNVYTDFLVLGNEPPRPPKVSQEDTETAAEVKREKMRVYQRYQNMSKKANEFQVPVLNTTRFLVMTGYDPQKKLD